MLPAGSKSNQFLTFPIRDIMQTQFHKHPIANETQTKAGFLEAFFWWEPPQDSLPVQFFQDTGLHGLKYIGQPRRHIIERIVWLAAFITGAVIALILIDGVWLKYTKNPVIVSFENTETKIEQIPFPAITICNVNNVLRSKAHGHIKQAVEENARNETTYETLKEVFYLNHICSSMALSFSQKFGYNANGSTIPQDLLDKYENLVLNSPTVTGTQQTDVKTFLQENAQSCTDMIHLCLWMDDVRDCNELFHPIETDFGKCCTFNMIPQSLLHTHTNDTRDNATLVELWSQGSLSVGDLLLRTPGEKSNEYPKRTKLSGSTYGLSFVLNPELREYFCATADGTGFQLVAHLPTQVPHVVDYGIAIEFNKEVYINVSPEITTSDKAVESIPLAKRKCYFDGEFSLKYYAYYTESNCVEECVANMTYKICGCVRYFMPTDYERQLCVPSKLNCTEGIKKKLGQEGVSGDCKNCLPTCTDINYLTTTSTSPMRDDVEIWIMKDGNVSDWANNSISIVHVFFGRGTSYAKIRKELYGITDLIANTGGLLGLCLGFSALSALELVYYVTLRAWFVFRSRKRNPTKTATTQDEISSLLLDVNTNPNRIQVLPVPIGNPANPYSQFMLSELLTYYNKNKISGP